MVIRAASFAALFLSFGCLAAATPSMTSETIRHYRTHDRKHDRKPMPIRLPTINVIPGTGTYSGSITVYHVAGIGTSTRLEGVRVRVAGREPVIMKIVNIDFFNEKAACSMEAGVCVIRP